MRSVGIDIAKTGWASIALVVDGDPVNAVVWRPDNLKASAAEMLNGKYTWTCFYLATFKPDVIAVEELQVFQNKKVIRALSHHEGVSLLAARRYGAIIVSPSPSQSRAVVFRGKGNMSKDDAWLAFKKKYPNVKLRAKTSGGLDQMDGYTHALAAPTLLERR